MSPGHRTAGKLRPRGDAGRTDRNVRRTGFSADAHLSKTKTVRTEGTESVAGVLPEQVVREGQQVWIIGWTADEYELPS